MDLESKHFSIVSPLPGETPPDNNFKAIAQFLRNNNVNIATDTSGIPMPDSQGDSNPSSYVKDHQHTGFENSAKEPLML